MTPMETARKIVADVQIHGDYDQLAFDICRSIQSESQAQLERGRARQAQLETMILEAYTKAFPNYTYTDSRSAIDLMLAEITTLRHEVNQRNG